MRSAVLWTLRSMVRLAGTQKKAAAQLPKRVAMSASTLGRYLRQGLPPTMSDAEVERLATELYRRARRIDDAMIEQRRQKRRELLARQPYAMAARRAAVRFLRGEERKLAATLPPRKSARAALARALGVTRARLDGWMKRGSVSDDFMPAFDEWAQGRVEAELDEKAAVSKAEELIELSRRPGLQPTVGKPGSPRAGKRLKAPQAPQVSTRSGIIDRPTVSGWQWSLSVEQWLSPQVIERMAAFAARVRIPRSFWRMAKWNVVALTSIYQRPGGKQHYTVKVRHFDRAHRDDGRNLNIGAPIASGTVHVRRGRDGEARAQARAVALFRAALEVELADPNLVWVHGVIVATWKVRSEVERQAWQRRQPETAEAEAIVAEAEAVERGERSPGKKASRARPAVRVAKKRKTTAKRPRRRKR